MKTLLFASTLALALPFASAVFAADSGKAADGEKRVLIVVTSADKLPDGRGTGVWLDEFTTPYDMLKEAGLAVTVASIRGGAVPLDPGSVKGQAQLDEFAEDIRALNASLPVADVKAGDFDAVFLPGGHGTMMDFPDNAVLQGLLADFAEQGKVIAAVCHGPAGFAGVKRRDGSFLVAGKTMTAFTDEEEKAVGATVPFMLESRLRSEGANFVARDKWSDHVETDGNLITGQNPASSASVARAIIERLAR